MLYYFKPRLLPTLTTILLLIIMVNLGIWQCHRAIYKNHLQTLYKMRQHLPAIPYHQLLQLDDISFYPVKVTGHFDTAHQFFLDNAILNHRVGYQVITPFYPQDGSPAILIERGWLPQGHDRRYLPQLVALPSENITLAVIIKQPEHAFTLGELTERRQEQWPLRITAIDIKQLSHYLGYPLQPFVALLSPDQPYGYIREWQPTNMLPQRHWGYAVQWFALSLTLLILYIVISVRKKP